ncbi:MAG: transporter [Candidatus Sericytochromatia bacterium]|nr:transporter [Candidatus Tanganyikabacteria bacterium]
MGNAPAGALAAPALALAAAAAALFAPPALACSSCGCGLPGSSSDVSSVGGAALLFGGESRWLVQSGISFRDITGSFNERGSWAAKPQGSTLTTVQGNLGLTYYPADGYTVGLQAPFAINRLVGAQWGSQGAVSPVDELDGVTGPRQAGGWGDLNFQASALLYRGSEDLPAVAAWAGLALPTGSAEGDAAAFTGSGVANGLIGLSFLKGYGPLELSASAAYQRPLTRPAGAVASAFYIGQALLGQAQADVEVFAGWKAGVGINGFVGATGVVDSAPTAATLSKLKVVPSLEWRPTPDEGVRAAFGADPTVFPGTNAMTDSTLYLVYFKYL